MSKKTFLFDPKSNALNRNDYRPSEYKIPKTDLHIDLDETETIVTSKLTIEEHPDFAGKASPLILDGKDLKLMSVKINGKELDRQDYTVNKDHLTIKRPPSGSFELEIQNEIDPKNNTALEGIYQSGDLICSQCEAQGFRHITYFLDRPDVLSRFTTTIEADKEQFPIILSNGNGDPAETKDLGNGRHTMTWDDPHYKPAYLFALVGGQLNVIEDTFTTMTGKKVDLRIFVQDGYEDKVDWAMESIKRSMKWDEERYGREYDLDVFHVVATDKFNMGAMENKGLNIFNVSLLVGTGETSTDSQLIAIEAVIGHEYFHNWSGNRVTVSDWFELTLKEGFTVLRDRQFTGDMHSEANKLIEDADLLKAHQFVEDSGPSAHPIRPERVEEFNNIYTGTIYEKGSHVLGMLHTLLGEETWRKATDTYFDRFDGQAVTCDDFVDVMQEVSGLDLTHFRQWYKQSGTPEITYKGEYDVATKKYTLTLTQNTPATQDQPQKDPLFMPIKIGLIGESGNDVDLGDGETTKTLILDKETQVFEFENVSGPVVPSILRGFSAPVKMKTKAPEDELIFRMAHDSDPYNRNEAANELKTATVLKMAAQIQNGEKPELGQSFIDAYRSIVDNALDGDMDFNASLLSLPAASVVAQEMDVIDPDAMSDAYKAMKQQIHDNFSAELNDIYQKTRTPANDTYEVVPAQVGRRALHNLSLSYLMAAENVDAANTAKSQFDNAGNMTERLGALNALNTFENEAGQKAMDTFLDKYKDNNNIVDMWLRLQGGAPYGDALQRVKDVMAKYQDVADEKDRVFDIKNPNKLRALIGSFAGNSKQFHRKDGEGYKFLADIIIQLNSLNPQIGARMTTPFMQWRRYDEERQNLMQKEMQRIKNTPDLAPGISELIGKALAQEPAKKNDAAPKAKLG